MEKVPIWRKLLHWPLVFGRESLWNTMSALSIPLMISRGIKEEMAMNVFVAGSVVSIINDIIGGWISEQCTCRLGRIGVFCLKLDSK